ncbi:MAG TPA: DNRLRE domain-containing protein [Polyangiaceae bacterium]|nr:DNRLRE domain-containing protein [Polyangiaceae bacterium]
MSCSVFPDHAVLPGTGGSGGGGAGGLSAGGFGNGAHAGTTATSGGLSSGGEPNASGGARPEGGAAGDGGGASPGGEAGMAGATSGGAAQAGESSGGESARGGSTGSGGTSNGGTGGANGGNGGATPSGGNGGGGTGTGGQMGTGGVCANPIVLTLGASADAYVSERSNEKKTNFGQGLGLRVGGAAGAHLHATLAFDLSALGAATKISRATLRVRLGAATTSSSTLSAYALAQPFVETEVTWERASKASSWVTGGGDTAVSASAMSAVAPSAPAGATVELDLRGEVSAIASGQRPNNGWLLSVSDGDPNLEFVSRESTFSDERPTLEITSCP